MQEKVDAGRSGGDLQTLVKPAHHDYPADPWPAVTDQCDPFQSLRSAW
jgi:hypothetical protein